MCVWVCVGVCVCVWEGVCVWVCVCVGGGAGVLVDDGQLSENLAGLGPSHQEGFLLC